MLLVFVTSWELFHVPFLDRCLWVCQIYPKLITKLHFDIMHPSTKSAHQFLLTAQRLMSLVLQLSSKILLCEAVILPPYASIFNVELSAIPLVLCILCQLQVENVIFGNLWAIEDNHNTRLVSTDIIKRLYICCKQASSYLLLGSCMSIEDNDPADSWPKLLWIILLVAVPFIAHACIPPLGLQTRLQGKWEIVMREITSTV